MPPSLSASASLDATFDTAGAVVNNAFDAGTAANRLMLVKLSWESNGNTIAGVTYNGISLTQLGAQVASGLRNHAFSLVAPATGSNTLAVDPSTAAANSAAIIEVAVYQDVDQTTPTDGYTTATGSDASSPFTSSITVTSAEGDLVVVWHSCNATQTAAAPTGYTERHENFNGFAGATMGDAAGAASVVTSCDWTGGGMMSFTAMGVNLNAASVAFGPEEEHQPAWLRTADPRAVTVFA